MGVGGVQVLLKRWLSFGCHETQVSVKQADMLEAMRVDEMVQRESTR